MKIKLLLISLFLGFCWTAKSQGFVYKPKNPAFGGESFIYQWLLSSAESQNLLKEPENPNDRDEKSQLDEFKENLNNQFLSRINRTLLNSQIDTNENLQPGVYNFGSLNVEVYESTEGLVVNILDTDTGEQTQIIIPN